MTEQEQLVQPDWPSDGPGPEEPRANGKGHPSVLGAGEPAAVLLPLKWRGPGQGTCHAERW